MNKTNIHTCENLQIKKKNEFYTKHFGKDEFLKSIFIR